jgi:hypothetical protein
MWATEPHLEHEGIAGATFDSEGHRLVGSVYLARGEEPKPTALLLHGCPGLVDGADHAFSWHRTELRELIAGWLDKVCGHEPAGLGM